MHTRMIQMIAKPGQVKLLAKTMIDRGLPVLKQQPGFVDALALTADGDRDLFVGVSIWKSKEDADNYAEGPARQMQEMIKPFIQQEPTFQAFNLEASTIHKIGVGRAA